MTKRIALAVMATLLSGCAHDGDPHRQPRIEAESILPASFEDVEAGHGALPQPVQETRKEWWRAAGDPVLDQLIDQALAANNDIAMAAARLGQAQAARRSATAARLPTLGTALQTSRNDGLRGAALPGDGSMSYQAEVSLGWDPDIFGKLRSNARAAQADLAAAGYDLANVRRAVASEAVRSYISYRAAQARRANAEQSLATQQEILAMVEKRYRLGLAVETDRQQARLQLLQVQAMLPQIRDQQNQLRNRIAVLLGKSPSGLGDILDKAGPVPLIPAPLDVGIPADLIRRRPDVQASQSRLLAAGARIGAARAAMLPQLSLSGVISSSAPTPAGLFDTILGQTIGRLATTLFSGGAARSAVAQSRAAAEESLAGYRGTLLAALESVENALSTARTSGERVQIDREALNASTLAAAQARRQHELGLIDFYVVLSAEQALLSQRDELVAAQAAQASAVADLYAAIGG